jgi:hypothetical protein
VGGMLRMQGDQMSLMKKSPKVFPNHFCHTYVFVEKVAFFQKAAKSKQLAN